MTMLRYRKEVHMPEDRNSKKAKRQIDNAAAVSQGDKTHITDPTHIAYQDRSFPVNHLTPKAREMLGFPADKGDY
jgi:hypothetical protein